jgi:predicted RNA binding protein YcfA (HicA-like mRNA interferase family)
MKAKELVQYAKAHGWQFFDQRGSHMIYKHPSFLYIVSIPDHGGKDLGKGLAATLKRQIDGTWKGAHS